MVLIHGNCWLKASIVLVLNVAIWKYTLTTSNVNEALNVWRIWIAEKTRSTWLLQAATLSIESSTDVIFTFITLHDNVCTSHNIKCHIWLGCAAVTGWQEWSLWMACVKDEFSDGDSTYVLVLLVLLLLCCRISVARWIRASKIYRKPWPYSYLHLIVEFREINVDCTAFIAVVTKSQNATLKFCERNNISDCFVKQGLATW